MANAENSNIDYVNSGTDDQDAHDFIGGECLVATRKRHLNNPSGRENDESTVSQCFEVLSEGEKIVGLSGMVVTHMKIQKNLFQTRMLGKQSF